MRTVVTGATGFIGRSLVLELLRLGHDVVVLTRDAVRAQQNLLLPVQCYEWDPIQGLPPQEALDGAEAVIHLLGEAVSGRWTEEKKIKIRDSRVRGTRNLVLGVQRSSSIKTLISASAIGYYGDCGDAEVDETSAQGADFLAEVCGDWELALDPVQVSSKVRVCKVRLGLVLGEGGGVLAQMLPVFAKGLGGRVGSGIQWMSWIHQHDLNRIFLFLLENNKASGVFNAVSPHSAQNGEWTRQLGYSLRKPAVLPVPTLALHAAFGEFADSILQSCRVLPKRVLELGFKFEFPQLRGAFESLVSDYRSSAQVLVSRQWVQTKIESVFEFFSDEKNLETLTPDLLHFKVLSKSTESLQAGTTINYRLRIHGIPTRWQTLIAAWKPPTMFIDDQVKGPYRKWHHTHTFEKLRDGTLISDRVVYELPFGVLGRVFGGSLVDRDVQKIFDFRKNKIRELFTKN